VRTADNDGPPTAFRIIVVYAPNTVFAPT
jgi:hypothetical protein